MAPPGGNLAAIDPCGGSPYPGPAPYNAPVGWPPDLFGSNSVTLSDTTSFSQRMNTGPGDAGFDQRWDIVPIGGTKSINLSDVLALGWTAPMFGGEGIFNKQCPYP